MRPAVPELAPLELAYKPDAAAAQQRMRAYWQGDITDRPCVSVQAEKVGVQRPKFCIVGPSDFDFRRAIAEFEEWASCTFFGGEAMPYVHPWWGPDQWAGFLGAKLTLRPEQNTSWVEPFVESWDKLLTIDQNNKWWQGILEWARLAAETGDGKYLVCAINSHSNVDALSAIRDPSKLCTDLIDDPDGVLKAVRMMDALYKPVYDAVFEAGKMAERGSTSWTDMYGEGRTQTVQCDFCYMVSSEHFRKFMLPSLEYEISVLDHAIYHMDGVGELRHLDDLLSIPNLHTIQWVPGTGQPRPPAWIDLYKKIQSAGKSVQVVVTADEAKAMYGELDPARAFYWIIGGCPTEAEAREFIAWIETHT